MFLFCTLRKHQKTRDLWCFQGVENGDLGRITQITLAYCRIAKAKQYSNNNELVFLVGNKYDFEGRRQVTFKQGQELADQLGCPFFEASVKGNLNVGDAFEKLIDIICDNMRATAESEPTDDGDANAGTGILRNAEENDVADRRKWCPWCK